MTNCWRGLRVTLHAMAFSTVAALAVAADQADADAAREPIREGSVHQLSAAAGVDIGDIHYWPGNVTADRNLESAILDQLDGYEYCDESTGDGLRYFYNTVDLNDDGAAETIVYLVSSYTCGSGGCTALIFQSDHEKLRLKSRFAPLNNPIVVGGRMTNGWRDLIVYVTGGGAKPAYHLLQHSEIAYPQNPSVAPTVEGGTVVDGDAYIANEISFDTPAPILRPRRCAAGEFDLMRAESFGDLRVDLNGDRVLASLGSPEVEGQPVMSEVDALFHQRWRYPGEDVVLDMVSESADGKQVIGSIEIGANSMLKTRQGIGIGDTYAAAAEAYAADRDQKGSDPPSTLMAGSVYGGLLFSFDGEGKVHRMLLGAKAE